MTSTSGPTSGAATPNSGPPAVPDLSGIASAITALHEFLRNGQATPDRGTFTVEQLQVESDFRALVRGLGRPRPEDRPGRFEWKVLVAGRVELVLPLPDKVKTVGGYTADRQRLWRVDVGKSSDRRVLTDKSIVRNGVVRLRAFDGDGRRLLVGFPARRTTKSPTVVTP